MSIENEKWKDVPGLEGMFQVSNFGRSRSLPRVVVKANGTHFKVKGKILSRPSGNNGAVFTFRDHGSTIGFRAARLVYLLFVGDIPEGLFVIHRNGDEYDCRIENLTIGTQDTIELGKFNRGTREKYTQKVKDIEFRTRSDGTVYSRPSA